MRLIVEFEDASAEQLLHVRYRDGAAPAGKNAGIAAEFAGLGFVYIGAMRATTPNRSRRCRACRLTLWRCSGCASAIPIRTDRRHQAASAAIFRPAPRGIQCGGALCSLCRLDTRLRAFQREQGDDVDTVDRAGDQPREIRSIAAWARPHTSSDRSAGISDQVGDMPILCFGMTTFHTRFTASLDNRDCHDRRAPVRSCPVP